MKTYEINFINKKTNKEKVLNFVLRLGKELNGKKGSKTFFRVLEFPDKIPNIKKYLVNTLIFVRQKYIWMKSLNLDEIIKF